MTRNDFNGDGFSDILWIKGEDLAVTNWLAVPSGGFVGNDANAYNDLNAFHHFEVTATGDFNGDGRSDVLWLIDETAYQFWTATADGGLPFQAVGNSFPGVEGWWIVGSGDFNGDSVDDLLWRASDGRVGNWLGNREGGFTINDASIVSVPNEWRVSGTGDFNGDGRSDIYWTSDGGMMGNWLGTGNGSFLDNSANSLAPVFARELLGIGDFDGDGLDDLLFRSETDAVHMLKTRPGGGFHPAVGSGFVMNVAHDWKVSAVGDYNGDSTDDLLWRNDNGALGTWLGIKGDGYRYIINDGAALIDVPVIWQVADNLLHDSRGPGQPWDY